VLPGGATRTTDEEREEMTDMDILETAGRYRVRLEIQQDSESANPRTDQDCNLTNVITPKGQRYIDVDENGGPLADGWERIEDRYVDAVPVFTRWARLFHGATVIEDRPHDGAWSLWYLMPDKAAETPWEPKRVIELEIDQYRKWAEGEVYGFIIEKDVTRIPRDAEDREDPDLDDETREWEHVDSCWGHIGREDAEEAAREAFAPYAEEAGK
jgi:hypothetical protein